MAQVGLHLPVFIACSIDARALRDRLAETIRDLSIRKASAMSIALEPRHWQSHATPGSGAPQQNIDHLITRSELFVAIIRSRVGSGLRYEIDLALKLARNGVIDNAFVYFEDPSEALHACDGDAEALWNHFANNDQLFTWRFRDEEDLAAIFQTHLNHWLQRWSRLPEICSHALRNSGPIGAPQLFDGGNKIQLLRSVWRTEAAPRLLGALGRCAVRHYQDNNGDVSRPLAHLDLTASDLNVCVTKVDVPSQQVALAVSLPTSTGIPRSPLVTCADGTMLFGGLEWYWYLCAVGLKDAILEARSECMEFIPYVNPVHQYLRAMVHGSDVDRIAHQLSDWLIGHDSAARSPIVRNFSAYVLGMIGASSAQDCLARAAEEDVGIDVMRYCVTSLGKLRARKHVPLLANLFAIQADQQVRLVIAQAICRIVGVAEYPM